MPGILQLFQACGRAELYLLMLKYIICSDRGNYSLILFYFCLPLCNDEELIRSWNHLASRLTTIKATEKDSNFIGLIQIPIFTSYTNTPAPLLLLKRKIIILELQDFEINTPSRERTELAKT